MRMGNKESIVRVLDFLLERICCSSSIATLFGLLDHLVSQFRLHRDPIRLRTS